MGVHARVFNILFEVRSFADTICILGRGGGDPLPEIPYPTKNRYLVVVENVCGGRWIYSARESTLLLFFCNGCRMSTAVPMIQEGP